MTSRDVILTGIPRSGTTLCCNLLGRAANTVALFEPMPVHELPLDPTAALATIADFFQHSRASLLASGTAKSQQVHGQVPDNPFDGALDGNGMRMRTANLGEIRVDKPLTPDFTLVIKHNATFTALLPALVPAYACYAVIRNPLAVLASWNSVDLPVAQGRLPAGERLDQALLARLDGMADVLERQLHLLDWLFGQFDRCLPATHIVRYEQVVATAGESLAITTGVPVPPLPLHSRNASHLYDAQASHRHAERLRTHEGPWRRFYGDGDVLQALDALQAQA